MIAAVSNLRPLVECAVVNNLEDAHELMDTAISTALKESKPVYISVGCNLSTIPHPTFSREPVPFEDTNPTMLFDHRKGTLFGPARAPTMATSMSN
ncbi:hypothetical protein L2E82_24788 [Cichorium intybus]|uniref:Uncharacterized protein n=1 Tax=Cichorium intybus TaxID=13427 RepID=A0ACB9E204_CICIN|nr:hypothetical protein L2E82_24788 [Cichorium intybus]